MQDKSGTRKSGTVKPVKRGRGRPPKDKALTEEQKIRFYEDDYRIIRAAAELDGGTPSGFIREAALEAAKARLARSAKR